MFKVVLFASLVIIASAQYAGYEYNGIPNPYEFSYSSPSIGGASSHQEAGDGTGRVQGSYSVVDEDGRTRIVEYVADELGFRANVQTNEPGTSNQQPANVGISSTAEDPSGAAINFATGPGGAPGVLPAY